MAVWAGSALVAGLAIGRFVAFDPQPVDPAPAAAAATPADAVRTLEAATAGNPSDAGAWRDLGRAYVRRSIETGDPSFYSLGEQAFERAEQLDPGNPATTLGRATLALTRHDFAEALRLADEARQANAFDNESLAVIVDAEVELGRYDAASAHLQTLLDLRPDLAALSRASYLRQLHGDLDGALTAMRQAEAAGAGSPFDLATVVTLRGDIHFARGELAAAGAAYDEAERLVPGLVPAQLGRARVLAGEGDRPGAIDLLEVAVERFPQPGAVTLLGELRALEGDVDGARSDFDLVRAIGALQRDNGANPDLELALFEADHGDPAAAVRLAADVYAARPTVYAADARAWSLLAAGDAAAALPFAEEALRLGTADALVRYHAAAVFEEAGDPLRATTELRRAFETNPWFSLAQIPSARLLAERLGVEVPEAWGGR